MSLLYADLSGLPVVMATLVIPYSGIWHADVRVDRAVGGALTTPQVLTLAGTTWACTPIRAVAFSGSIHYRLVGGTAGWRSTVPFMPYFSPSGVPTSMVTTDVAGVAREIPPIIDPTIPPTVGTYFCRQAGPASLVLNQVLGDRWWMDPTGTVQTIPRPPTLVASPFDAIDAAGEMGRYIIATEFPLQWLPGATFLGPTVSGTVSRVVFELKSGTFRTEVLSSP